MWGIGLHFGACGELKVDTYRYFKDIEKDNLL